MSRLNLLAFAVAALVLSGCATPVAVDTLDAADGWAVPEELHGSVTFVYRATTDENELRLTAEEGADAIALFVVVEGRGAWLSSLPLPENALDPPDVDGVTPKVDDTSLWRSYSGDMVGKPITVVAIVAGKATNATARLTLTGGVELLAPPVYGTATLLGEDAWSGERYAVRPVGTLADVAIDRRLSFTTESSTLAIYNAGRDNALRDDVWTLSSPTRVWTVKRDSTPLQPLLSWNGDNRSVDAGGFGLWSLEKEWSLHVERRVSVATATPDAVLVADVPPVYFTGEIFL